MRGDAGGWLWLLIDVGFVLILAIALVYGIAMWNTRRQSGVSDRERDEATRRLYRNPNAKQDR